LLFLLPGQTATAQRALPPTEVKIIRRFERPEPIFFEHITHADGTAAGTLVALDIQV